MTDGTTSYPGEDARPAELLALAIEYHRSADALAVQGRRGEPLSRAPWRLIAIHAIELYLNALLLDAGISPAEIRGFQHDLSARRDRALGTGIILRSKTAAHLESMTRDREYLSVRYATRHATKLSHVNRLQATLEEIARHATETIAAADNLQPSSGEGPATPRPDIHLTGIASRNHPARCMKKGPRSPTAPVMFRLRSVSTRPSTGRTPARAAPGRT